MKFLMTLCVVAILALVAHAAYRKFEASKQPPDAIVVTNAWWDPEFRDLRPVHAAAGVTPASFEGQFNCAGFSTADLDFEVLVDANGKFCDARVLSMNSAPLARCLLDGMRRAHFTPAQYRGRPVASVLPVTWSYRNSCPLVR